MTRYLKITYCPVEGRYLLHYVKEGVAARIISCASHAGVMDEARNYQYRYKLEVIDQVTGGAS